MKQEEINKRMAPLRVGEEVITIKGERGTIVAMLDNNVVLVEVPDTTSSKQTVTYLNWQLLRYIE